MREVLGWCRAFAVRLASRLRVRRHWRLYLALLCGLGFLHFIWPTPYIYRSQETGWGKFARINRITQNVCVLRGGKWVSVRSLARDAERRREEAERRGEEAARGEQAAEARRVLPASELKKVALNPVKIWGISRTYCKYVNVHIRNGTDKPLAELAIDVSVHDKDGSAKAMVYPQEFETLYPPISPGAQNMEIMDLRPSVRIDPDTQRYSVRLRAARWAKEDE